MHIYERITKNSENIFLILFIGILLWMSLGPIMHYKLVHNRLTGFGASDAYAWFAYAQNIYESGSFKNTPPFMNLGLEGLTSPEPPLFVQFTAYLAYALGIPVYDAQILFGVLLLIFSVLIFFILIREYNLFLAYLSLPLTTFSFTFPFIAWLIYGVLPSMFSFLFLFAALFMLFHAELKYYVVILGVFISAILMGHPFRVLEFTLLGGSFILLAFIFKHINLSFIKKLFVSGLIAIGISWYYLPIFLYRFFHSGEASLSFIPQDAAKYLRIALSDFESVQYVILPGLVLCLYFLIKERKNIKGLVFVFPIAVFLITQFFRLGKLYQLTFLWPIFFGLPFGLLFFFVLRSKWFSKTNKHKSVYFIISLTISILFIYQYYYFFREPILEKISENEMAPISSQDQWDDLIWLSKNTEPDSKILFFYFNDQPNDDMYHFFPSKRVSFYVPLSEIDSAIEQNITKKDYKIFDNSVAFFYKRDTDFPLKIVPFEKPQYAKTMSICDFDYIYTKRAIRVVHSKEDKAFLSKTIEKRVYYAIEQINTLLKNKNFRIIRQDDEAYIIKNNKPGGICI